MLEAEGLVLMCSEEGQTAERQADPQVPSHSLRGALLFLGWGTLCDRPTKERDLDPATRSRPGPAS